MQNLIVFFFNHFPCMYMGLFVRDECESLVKNQVSRVESVDFTTGSRVIREKQLAKMPCVEHMSGRRRVVSGYHFCDCFARRANPRRTRESLYLAKSCVLLYLFFTHIIYTLITHEL